MPNLSRRKMLASLVATSTFALDPIHPAMAQTSPAPPRFGFEDVVKRARDIAQAPFAANPPALPDPIASLDFDAWRDIRFKADRALLGANGGPFRLQTFHLGHLFKQPVTVNTIRDGIATPIPYAANLFSYGRTKIERPLPVNLGFAGFRLHYPLNQPGVMDEVIAFLGASYFRFLGRHQRYGLSARALCVNAGTEAEEFPFFREFWVETPEPGAERATLFALLDSDAATGAFRFDIYPGPDTAVDVTATLFARKAGVKFGLAPLTSMFFTGENDRRFTADFRPELHDSDGLLQHSGNGEWIWRPLRNPTRLELSTFLDSGIKGFGLMQRDRTFEHYQDLDLAYEMRPAYFVEPRENWGEGRVELVELPTTDETNDNIVAAWTPKDPLEPGKPFTYGYRITATLDAARLSPGGRTLNTYLTQPRALGSGEPLPAGARRFIIDFSGGDLEYYLHDPALVEAVPTTTNGRILRAFLVPNQHTRGFRAAIDVQLEPGQSTDLRAFLKTGNRALTETWTLPWKPE